MQRIAQQQYAQDLAGFANVAMTPYMQRQLPPALQMPQQRSSGFNTMLQIGNAALGGIQAYGALAPPAAGGLPFDTSGVGNNFTTKSLLPDYSSFNVKGF